MMDTKQPISKTIDEYIAGFPREVREILEKIRAIIKQEVPGVEETISYQIPTFKWNGTYLIYFAAYKKHVSLYPAPVGVSAFKNDLEKYQTGKGTLQFPLDQPIPYALITKLVKYKVKEALARTATKKK